MKLPDVRNALYRELASHLPGWKLVKKSEAFVRDIPGGTQMIGVPVYDYRPEFRFSLVLQIQLDAVGDIINQASGATSPGNARPTTSITTLDYFFPGERPPKQFAIRDEAQLNEAIAALAPVIHDKILPFFDRHRDVVALDSALNGDDTNFDRSDVTQRIVRSLVVAHLAGNRHFDELVGRYTAAMSTFPEPLKQRVAQLVEYLRAKRAS